LEDRQNDLDRLVADHLEEFGWLTVDVGTGDAMASSISDGD